MFDILFFGVETPIGQIVFKRLHKQFPGLSIVVPMSDAYGDIDIPENQIYLDFGDLKNELQYVDFQVILNCNPSLILPQNFQSKIIDGTISFPQMVVRSGCAKMRYNFSELSVFEDVSFSKFLSYSISDSSNLPSFSPISRTTTIETEVIPFGKINVKHYISFSSSFIAYLFWFFALLLHLVLFFVRRKRSKGSKKWKFIGACLDKTRKHRFVNRLEISDQTQLVSDYIVWCLKEKLKIKMPLGNMFPSFKVCVESYKSL